MDLLQLIGDNWELVSGAIATLLVWHKETIANKLNIKQKKTELTKSEKGIDTVYIQNSEKLVEIYSRSMDDMMKKHREDMDDMKNRHSTELHEIKAEHSKNLQEFKEESKKVQMEADGEKKTLKETVDKLQLQVKKLTMLVEKLGKQIAFYKAHSDLELPNDLQD